MQPMGLSAPADESGPWVRQAVRRLAADLRAHHQPAVGAGNRVARRARRIADRLDLDPISATEAELIAILHEVGRLAAPPELLDEGGTLTPAQRDVVRTRTIEGAELLAARAGLDHLGPVVHAVHEHWDGSGLPEGLAGEAIPLPARIVAVVDAHDAMIRGRTGRRRLTDDEARMRLAVEAGWRFDPRVVTTYLDELRDGPQRRFTRDVPPPPPPRLPF